MKRGLILAALVAALIFACISVSEGKMVIEQGEIQESENHAKPVMVPYLNMDVHQFAELREVRNVTNRLVKRDLQRISENEYTSGLPEQDSDRTDEGCSKSEIDPVSRGEGGIIDDEEAGAEEQYSSVESEVQTGIQEETEDSLSVMDTVSEGEGSGECDGNGLAVWDESGEDDQSDSGDGSKCSYLGAWTVTAYCPCPICCGEWSTGYTASGTIATANHTVACNALPFGTQIIIDDIVYTVEDTGYSPYGDAWLDIFFDSHDEALAFGVRTKDVYLVVEEE